MFKNGSQWYGGSHFSSSFNTNPIIQEEIEKLKLDISQTKDKLLDKKVQYRLARWKMNYLSMARTTILAQSVMGTLPIYSMQLA